MNRAQIRLSATLLVGFVVTVGTVTVLAGQLPTTTTTSERIARDEPASDVAPEVAETVAALGLVPGQVVADIGAGTGIYSVPMAEAVGPDGVVYAEEVDPELIEHLQQKVDELQLTNVRVVLGGFTDPELPTRDVDLAFFRNVLHHVEDRPALLRTLVTYLEPDGRIVIIDGGHVNDPTLHVPRAQADALLAEAGFSVARPVEGIVSDPNYFVIYSRE